MLQVLDMSHESAAIEGFFCVISYCNKFERLHQVGVGESIIGRADHCGILLLDGYVSREHAIVGWSGQCATIRDCGSRNGTVVNEVLVDRDGGELMLKNGDRIQVGPYCLQVCFKICEAVGQSAVLGQVDETTRSSSSPLPNGAVEKRPVLTLTPAQRRVYDGFADGLSEKEVASRLKLSIHTVHSHAKAIYRSLAVSSRGELMKRVAQIRCSNDR